MRERDTERETQRDTERETHREGDTELIETETTWNATTIRPYHS